MTAKYILVTQVTRSTPVQEIPTLVNAHHILRIEEYSRVPEAKSTVVFTGGHDAIPVKETLFDIFERING